MKVFCQCSIKHQSLPVNTHSSSPEIRLYNQTWLLSMSNKAKSLVYSITINVNVLGAFIFLSFCKTSGTWKNLFLYGTMLTRNYKNALFVRNVLKKENPQVFHEMFIIISYIKTTPTTPELLYHFLDILQVKLLSLDNIL